MSYVTSARKTPLLIFDGNCQAHHLAAIFDGAGLAEAYCTGEDYGFVPSYMGTSTVYCTLEEALSYVSLAKSAGRTVIQVSQSTQMQAEASTEYTPLVDKIVKFPYLQYYCISPDEFRKVYGRTPASQRMLDFDLSLMGLCQDKAQSRFDFVSFVRDVGRQKLLFNTHSHPRGPLMSRLFLEVAQKADVFDDREVDALRQELEGTEGINHVTIHPISSEIIESLGFDWGEQYSLLTACLTAAFENDWAEVVRLCEASPYTINDSQLLLALGRAYLHLGDLEGHGWVYKRLTDLSPGFMHAWFLRLDFWRRLGNDIEMRECRLEMRRALGNSRYYSQTRAWMDIQDGQLESALQYAYDYLQRSPDMADGIVVYAKALALMGRSDEARDAFYTYACNSGVENLEGILHQLNHLEELSIDAGALSAMVKDVAEQRTT